MIPVIKHKKWVRWCQQKKLNVLDANFALDTCYYGFGLRTRPGTIILTNHELIHHSYSWRDSLWAVFEKPVRISIPFSTIQNIQRVNLNIAFRLLHALPNATFRILTNDGISHDFVLQRKGTEFLHWIYSLCPVSSVDPIAVTELFKVKSDNPYESPQS